MSPSLLSPNRIGVGSSKPKNKELWGPNSDPVTLVVRPLYPLFSQLLATNSPQGQEGHNSQQGSSAQARAFLQRRGDCGLLAAALSGRGMDALPSNGDLSGPPTAPTTEAERRERQLRIYGWLLELCLTKEYGQGLVVVGG